jgi:hypothetical protein
MTKVGPRPGVLPNWTLTMWLHRAVAHGRFEVKGLTTRGEVVVGLCGWHERVHERCQWMNAHGQSTSLVYGNPVPDARLRHIMAILPLCTDGIPDDGHAREDDHGYLLV